MIVAKQTCLLRSLARLPSCKNNVEPFSIFSFYLSHIESVLISLKPFVYTVNQFILMKEVNTVTPSITYSACTPGGKVDIGKPADPYWKTGRPLLPLVKLILLKVAEETS